MRRCCICSEEITDEQILNNDITQYTGGTYAAGAGNAPTTRCHKWCDENKKKAESKASSEDWDGTAQILGAYW